MNKNKPFYKLKVDERIKELKSRGFNFDQYNVSLMNDEMDLMIENFITTYELPVGIVNDVIVNDHFFNLLLATEEPSIVAGISKATKIINKNGGFIGEVISSNATGQIIIKNSNGDIKELINKLKIHEKMFYELAIKADPVLHQIGGGIVSVDYRKVSEQFLSIDVEINPVDAMGANLVNTILEEISNYLVKLEIDVLAAIITNLATNSLVQVKCEIDLVNNEYININSAQKIVDLTNYAKLDSYRATTHNKGILNGVSSFIIASGNDFRANSAGIITYSLLNDKVMPLSNWQLSNNQDKLIGTIKIPIQVGIIGTNMNKIPKVKLFYELTKINNRNELMILSAVSGLASNFASLLALITEGIQKGHMKLVNRNK